MELLNNSNGILELAFSKDEFGIIRATSIHVLYSFAVGSNYNIKQSTGWKKEEARSFSEKIRKADDNIIGNEITYFFSRNEIIFIIKVINYAISEINLEFQTLLGYTIEEAEQVKSDLTQIIKKV